MRGKCRSCNKLIPYIYPLIELTTGILFYININANPSIYSELPKPIIILMSCFLTSIFILLSVFDFKFFWLPSALTIGATIIGLLTSFVVDLFIDNQVFTFFKFSLFGSIFGFFILYFISSFGRIIFKKSVMGIGDIFLCSFIGSWLGVKGVFCSIWIAFNVAGLFVILGLILKKIRRNQKIPFGIFLSISGLIVWYFGEVSIMRFIYLMKI